MALIFMSRWFEIEMEFLTTLYLYADDRLIPVQLFCEEKFRGFGCAVLVCQKQQFSDFMSGLVFILVFCCCQEIKQAIDDSLSSRSFGVFSFLVVLLFKLRSLIM